MSKLHRFNYVVEGLFMLLYAILLIIQPTQAYAAILGILGLSMIVYGINQFIYYLRLARYMVGGILILCKALIILNFGLEALYLTNVHKMYIMIYFAAGLAFTGIVDILRALETKKVDGKGWKLKFIQGVITIVVSIIGLIFGASTNAVVYFFSFGLISSALTKISEAFRKTDIIYIQ